MISLSLFLIDFMRDRIIYTGLAPEKRASKCISVIDLSSQVVLVVKNPPVNAGDGRDTGSIPGLGRFHRRKHGNPLKCSCLENSMDSPCVLMSYSL